MLLETIRCEEGKALYLSYHQQRLNQSLQALGIPKNYDLGTLIAPPQRGLFRCRFLYNALGHTIEYHPYTPKIIASLKLIHADTVEYPFKYADRDVLNALYDQRDMHDDILIVKNGLLTDTTIANIALKIEGQWFTPDAPLLMGTTRARLIETGFLTPVPLTPNDIDRATKIAVMNAMVGFIEVDNGIIS